MIPFILFLLLMNDILLISSSTFVTDEESFGILDLLEVDNKRYELEITTSPVKEETMRRDEERMNTIVMKSKYGQKYQCILPDTALTESQTYLEDSSIGTDVSDLLQPLKDTCQIYNEGWWTYKHCHGDQITQYHTEGGQVVGDVIHLGHYESEEDWNEEKIKTVMRQKRRQSFSRRHPSQKSFFPSHDVKYTNGTLCPLKDQPRLAIVKLVCSQFHTSTQIIRIVEGSTCNYTLTVHAPYLCDHLLFIPNGKLGLSTVQCSPILEEDKYNRYMDYLQKKKQASDYHADQTNAAKHIISDRKTVPLMNLLEKMSISIAKEVTFKVNIEEGLSDDGEVDEDLDGIIEDLVAKSFDEVFDKQDKTSDTSKTRQKDLPSGSNIRPKAAKNSETDKKVNSEQLESDTDGHQTNDITKTGTTLEKDEEDLETESFTVKNTEEAGELLTSILLEVLKSNDDDNNDNNGGANQRKLQELYHSSWEPPPSTNNKKEEEETEDED